MLDVKLTRRHHCATLSFGAAVSLDPAFYVRQMEDIKNCKTNTDRLIVRFDHVQPDTTSSIRWDALVEETMMAVASSTTGRRFANICLLIMGGTVAIPSAFVEYITTMRHHEQGERKNGLEHLEILIVGEDAQVDAMTFLLQNLAQTSINITQVTLGFSWCHARADDQLGRLSKSICGIVESSSFQIESLHLSKIRFQAEMLGSIVSAVEKYPLDLEMSGLIGTTRDCWSKLEEFKSTKMLALAPYSGQDFPVATLLGNRTNLSSLSIDVSRCGPCHDFQPAILIEAFRCNTSIHTLSLRGCQNLFQLSFLTRLLPTLKHVKHLEWEYIDYDHSRDGQWPTASIVDAFRQNFSVQSFVLRRHRKETDVDEYSLFSPMEETQIRNCLNRNKAMAEWAMNPFEMPRELIPRTVTIAMANGNTTFVYKLLRELNVSIGPVII